MRMLTGLYKAVCLDVVGSTRIRCKIPQIFGEEIVTILDSSGAMPAAGQEGWVAFESGFPDRPVWMGANLKGGITDHGALLGLEDDDHPQYLTNARGDALFLTPAEGDALFLTPAEGNAAYSATTHNHDAAYVNVSGDTMTGPLVVPTTPTAAGEATSKSYVDSRGSISVVTSLPGTLTANVLYVVV